MAMNALEQNIMEALAGNSRVHPDEISVQAFGGDVTLRGTVGSVVQREAAVRTTRQVTGVTSVTDRLRLGLLDASRHADADTEAAVLDALNADTAVRASPIDVAVRDGAVTLSGLVDLASQRDRAERDTLAVPGVASVHNGLRIAFPVSADDIAERITDAIGVNAIVGADSITVTVHGNAVTLSGTVRSRADHDTALMAAARAPGVTDVRDEMRVMG
jgi:osmotically-inducible protein OsmY